MKEMLSMLHPAENRDQSRAVLIETSDLTNYANPHN
jgi:hypothetical protein